MTKSRIPFALILISIAVIMGMVIALYLLLNQEIAKIKSEGATPTPTADVEPTPVANKSNYTHEYLVYLDAGELFSMKYDGSEQEQLTETEGRVSSFNISPDNQYLAYTVAQEFGFGEIPSAYAAKFVDKDAKHPINTELFELNLVSGESTRLLEALANTAYENELKRLQIKPFAYTGVRTSISGLSYIPSTEGRYLIYSRYEDIATDLEQALKEQIVDSAFVLDPLSGKADKITGQPWITALQWSASGNYAILSDYDYELYRDTIYDLRTLPLLKRVSSATSFEFGTSYSFLKNTDTVVELGTEFTSSGSVNIYREIDPATKKVVKDEKPNTLADITRYQVLNTDANTSFVLANQADTHKILQFAPEQELIFDSSTMLEDDRPLRKAVGQGDFSARLSASSEMHLLAQWYSKQEGKLTIYIYDLNTPGESLYNFEITPQSGTQEVTPAAASTLQFFYPVTL